MIDWIRCGDEMPQQHEQVLLYRPIGAEIMIGYLSQNQRLWIVDIWDIPLRAVSHWAELPEPPNGGISTA